jgi:ketopantoate reductase
MSKSPVIVIGIGEMGSVFARGLLRLGHPVYPVTRETDMQALAAELPDPAMVLVAVGEAALPEMLAQIPAAWGDKLALLQNELLPADYAQLQDPTVISVWFEKKKGQDSKVLVPSPAFGPRAQLLMDALGSLDIATKAIDAAEDMLFELVVKNVYIVTTNIAGLRVGGNVGELWQQHEAFAREVANDVIDIQEALTGATFDREALIQAMLVAFKGDLEHKCMGRSAPARLQRALAHAEKHGLGVPTLKAIAAEQAQA